MTCVTWSSEINSCCLISCGKLTLPPTQRPCPCNFWLIRLDCAWSTPGEGATDSWGQAINTAQHACSGGFSFVLHVLAAPTQEHDEMIAQLRLVSTRANCFDYSRTASKARVAPCSRDPGGDLEVRGISSNGSQSFFWAQLPRDLGICRGTLGLSKNVILVDPLELGQLLMNYGYLYLLSFCDGGGFPNSSRFNTRVDWNGCQVLRFFL